MRRPEQEESILQHLDDAIRQPRAAKLLAAIADDVDQSLESDANTRLAWKSIPLSVYDDLPDGIASSWIFSLRAGSSSGAERHPNSVQRFMSYRGFRQHADLERLSVGLSRAEERGQVRPSSSGGSRFQ